MQFASRRSAVALSPNSPLGMVSSPQPAASHAGSQILRLGGNAADAAVAAGAALAVILPGSTGCGGDAFALFFKANAGSIHSSDDIGSGRSWESDGATGKSAVGEVFGLNGCGRAPLSERCVAALGVARAEELDWRSKNANVSSPDGIQVDPFVEIGMRADIGGASVTVPGAVAAWVDTFEQFGSGKVTLAQILAPAIALAEDGWVVQPVAAEQWASSANLLRRHANGCALLYEDKSSAGGDASQQQREQPSGYIQTSLKPRFAPALPSCWRPPRAGEVMKNPDIARTLRAVAEHGKEGFYRGPVAEAIVDIVKANGGTLELEDLSQHTSSVVKPIHVRYRDVDVWEIPPNGQGLAALQALRVSECISENNRDTSGGMPPHGTAPHYHQLIESMRLAFADAARHIADPDFVKVPVEALLSDDYVKERASVFTRDKAVVDIIAGSPTQSSGTVYLCVVDADGNACSFINSNYMGFGTGLVPDGCGFSLQNRGANFSTESDHPNCIQPGKRPYHTIIPGMVTRPISGGHALVGPFGVMGGFMQPQGHLQVITNMVDYGMDPQTALDAARFCIMDGRANGGEIVFEEGVDPQILRQLRSMGHPVRAQPLSGTAERTVFGNGQIIWKDPSTGVLRGGCDGRHDSLIALG